MLDHTFVHISGIGRQSEALFWRAGLPSPSAVGLLVPSCVPAAKARLVMAHQQNNPAPAHRSPHYWASRLPGRELWRLFPHFRSTTAYLDIETTGSRHAANSITTIALYDGTRLFTFVRGRNLADFARVISQYTVLVTYNGSRFDLPIIATDLGLRLDQVHLDLCPLLRHLGFSGGLKGCEKKLGINRGELAGLDGAWAVILWREYRRTGNPRALETLLAYNLADVINLEPLLIEVYNRNLAATPFAEELRIPPPTPPPLPCRVDPQLIQQLRCRFFG